MTSKSNGPEHRELPSIPGGWRDELIEVGCRTYRLSVPVDPDLLLELPETLAEHNADDYMPYWAWLWPAALNMAKWAASQTWTRGTPALELGSGMGLVGMIAASHGLDVTITDYRPEAVELVEWNLRSNKIAANAKTIDWRKEPKRQWPVILSCDVLYERSNHSAIAKFIATALSENGVCWIGDPGRAHANAFIEVVNSDDRLSVELVDELGNALEELTVGEFLLLRIVRG